MRKDMAKVIVDDYSSHNGKKFRYQNFKRMQNKLHNDPEYYGNRMPMSPARSYGWDTRNSPDRLQPLQGYLEKHVGEDWDDIYSDIVQSLKRGGFGKLLNRHLLEDHLKYMVFKKVIKKEDGTIIAHSRWWCREIHEGDLYVDPDTNLLTIVGDSCRIYWPEACYHMNMKPHERDENGAVIAWKHFYETRPPMRKVGKDEFIRYGEIETFTEVRKR